MNLTTLKRAGVAAAVLAATAVILSPGVSAEEPPPAGHFPVTFLWARS